ncbi:MAG: hypothetical protein IT577_15020 [Verrucomicrobiae bacterium]|nr:hypothetical protein [Verrucomicrobiae bacterium]
MKVTCLATLAALLAMGHCGGAATNAPSAAAAPPSQAPALLSTIEELVAQRTALRAEFAERRKEIDRAQPGPVRESLQQEADRIAARIATLQGQLQVLATGSDPDAVGPGGEEAFDLREEVVRLVRPLIEQFRRASEQPRKEEALRGSIEKERERLEVAGRALERVNALLGNKALSREGRRALEEVRDQWAERRKEIASRLEVASVQLRQTLEQKRPLIESLAVIARDFFRMRGRNLVLAGLAAIAGFLLVRLVRARLQRSGHRLFGLEDSLYARATHLALHVFSVAAAVLAAMLALYYVGDWVLLGLLILILLGLGFAARNSLPLFIDEARSLLNLGGVREGERIVIDGIPWRVDKLDFLATLGNPAMPGLVVRYPLRKISEMVSRPPVAHEPWFPCRGDDWVLLGDGTVAKVVVISPEVVEVVRVGGLHKTYRTLDFLALAPANLSRGFRATATFGIDYRHQADAVGPIPEALREHIFRRLIETVGRDALHSLKVELQMAGPSSIDFVILADFDGAVAERYDSLSRCLQRFAVEACEANGWVIPFAQITVHGPAGMGPPGAVRD